MKKESLVFLVGAFGCLFIAVNPMFAQVWTPTSAPTNAWSSVACSADGARLVAAAKGGGIFTSTDSGATWMLTSAPTFPRWTYVASSADGTQLAAVSAEAEVNVYVSTNSGAVWSNSNGGMPFYPLPEYDSPRAYAVCLSADGTKLVVVENIFDWWIDNFDYGLVFNSTNFGATWNTGYQSKPYGSSWSSVATSADGTRLVAASPDSLIYTATVSPAGAAWAQATNAPVGVAWTSVASSADGTRLVAAGCYSIYTSPDSGSTWIRTDAPSNAWTSVASSADGSKLIAAATNSVYSIYTSTDSGATWTPATNGPSGVICNSVASSADGSKLVAAVYGGGIYTSQTTPVPVLNLTPLGNQLAFSWIIPSTDFVLQQSSDLAAMNWTVVTNTPALNPANLQNQVALPLPAGNVFYRLKSP
jgi:photosystem II stability/assembly factor-like uncharacterized protein